MASKSSRRTPRFKRQMVDLVVRGGLTTPEREESSQLRRENRKLKEEREILSKAAAWFATESGTDEEPTSDYVSAFALSPAKAVADARQ